MMPTACIWGYTRSFFVLIGRAGQLRAFDPLHLGQQAVFSCMIVRAGLFQYFRVLFCAPRRRPVLVPLRSCGYYPEVAV